MDRAKRNALRNEQRRKASEENRKRQGYVNIRCPQCGKRHPVFKILLKTPERKARKGLCNYCYKTNTRESIDKRRFEDFKPFILNGCLLIPVVGRGIRCLGYDTCVHYDEPAYEYSKGSKFKGRKLGKQYCLCEVSKRNWDSWTAIRLSKEPFEIYYPDCPDEQVELDTEEESIAIAEKWKRRLDAHRN